MSTTRLQRIVEALDFDLPFRVLMPDGAEARIGDEPPAFTLHFKTHRAVRETLAKSSLGFGEAYTRGDIDIDGDVGGVALLSFALRERLLKGALGERLRYALEFLGRANSRAGSRRNIAAHYDLSNDFYRLWLDEAMQYTCAYFAAETDTLEAAQFRKMERVCAKLGLKPGELVVEAGGGWGGLALHMASRHGVRVKSFNISAAQVAFARERAQARGLSADQLEYIQDDYRNIPEHVAQCDKFASICMLEHVGRENYAAFHRLVAEVLRPRGLAMLQFISRERPSRLSNPWLEKHVFPGYYNPSLGEIVSALETCGNRLQIVDVENMRYHYALTLTHWLRRFEANAETIRERWGEAVVRTFRLYLNGGLADFAHAKGTLVYQALLSHGGDNTQPLTRLHHDKTGAGAYAPAARVRTRQTA